jgi:hypothetical protein
MTNATSIQIATAEGHRAAECQRLRKLLDALDREQRSYQFKQDAYSRQRMQEITAQREETLSEIERLDSLTGNELVDRFLPGQRGADMQDKAAQEAEGIDRNAFLTGRGEYGSSQVVVTRSAPHGYRTAETFPVDPIGLAKLQQEAAAS